MKNPEGRIEYLNEALEKSRGDYKANDIKNSREVGKSLVDILEWNTSVTPQKEIKADTVINLAELKSEVKSQGGSMSSADSYQNQLELMDELRNQVISLIGNLEIALKSYTNQTQAIMSSGLLKEHVDYCSRNAFDPTKEALSRIILHLQERDLKITDKEISYLGEKIERLKSDIY